MYDISVDAHTHSVASGHAFSTVLELCTYAKRHNLDAFVLTDHSPTMPGGPVFFIPTMFPSLPKEIDGVRIFYGMEVDVLNKNADMGLERKYMRFLDFCIASFHDVCYTHAQNETIYTDPAMLALEDPYVDMLGHPGNPTFPVDVEAVVRCAKKHNKLIEVNNHSFNVRKGSKENCLEFLKYCKKHDVRVSLSSDAHIATAIGKVENCKALLSSVDFPEELVINTSIEKFMGYLEERKTRLSSIR